MGRPAADDGLQFFLMQMPAVEFEGLLRESVPNSK